MSGFQLPPRLSGSNSPYNQKTTDPCGENNPNFLLGPNPCPRALPRERASA
jgi:hypothetical protein